MHAPPAAAILRSGARAVRAAPAADPGPAPLRPTRVRDLVVLVATLMAVLLYLHRFCLSFAEVYISEDLHLSTGQAAWLLSAFFWTYALAQLPAGWLGDRFGVRFMLTLYILLWSLCTGLVGAAAAFAVLLALRFGCGLAQAGAYPTSAALLGDWVPFGRRGLASSIVSNGGRLGGVLAPVLTAYLIHACGWRPALILYGAAGLVVAALFWLIVRNRPEQHPLCNAAEVRLIEAGRPPEVVPARGPAPGLPLGPILRSRSLWLCSAAQFGTNFGWTFLLTWLPRYLVEVHRVPIVERGWMVGVPILVGMGGQFAGGWLTDRLTRGLGLRLGRCLPISLSRFVAMAAFLLCPLLRSPWAVTAALAVVALATDLGTPATWAYCQDVGGRDVGSVLGWGNMWGNLASALSPPVLSAIAVAWGWPALFVACAAAFLLAGVTALGIDATAPVFPREKGPK